MKLRGRYKGTRRRKAPKAIVRIECPGCGWKGGTAEIAEAEAEYILHLEFFHYGPLECAFCDNEVGRGFRLLPSFETLAAHVQHFHADIIARHEKTFGEKLPQGSLVPHSFK